VAHGANLQLKRAGAKVHVGSVFAEKVVAKDNVEAGSFPIQDKQRHGDGGSVNVEISTDCTRDGDA